MIDAPHWEAIHPLFKRHQQQLRANLQIDMKDQFCTHRGESSTVPVVEDEDEDYIGEDLDDINSFFENKNKNKRVHTCNVQLNANYEHSELET